MPISALQHLAFCERRAVLVHVEAIWADNTYTAEGTLLHQRSHDTDVDVEVRDDVRIARGLMLRSLELGLTGRADVVEFHRAEETRSSPADHEGAGGVILPGVPGRWFPFLVEYKRGRLRREEGYEIQLCAQAICLEEMLNTQMPAGALYYGSPRRRLEIQFTASLRLETRAAAERLHDLVASGVTPPAGYAPKCKSCSLLDVCLPKALSGRRSASRYVTQRIADAEREG